MPTDSLSESPVGKLIPFVGPDPATQETVNGLAFLPDPLPRSLSLSTPTWNIVNTATAALARLDGAARQIPNPALLRGPALRREAQSTSALEGTYAPFAEVMAADEFDQGQMSAELREILNFETAAKHAFDWPRGRPITIAMLGDLQAALVRNTASERPDSGGLREGIVVIGQHGRGLDEARFVPPPPTDQLRAGMEELLKWIEGPPDLPAVVQAALCHYQFEVLHPFSDGNGRIGRLMAIVQLLRQMVIREPLLVVSPWFEKRRLAYQDGLLDLSCSGDWDSWVAFFAQGVAASAMESQRKVERLVDLQSQLTKNVRDAGKRGAAERIASDLIGRPFITGPEVSTRYNLSGQGATNAIKTLVDLNILSKTPMKLRHGAQLYVAPAVLAALEKSEARSNDSVA